MMWLLSEHFGYSEVKGAVFSHYFKFSYIDDDICGRNGRAIIHSKIFIKLIGLAMGLMSFGFTLMELASKFQLESQITVSYFAICLEYQF